MTTYNFYLKDLGTGAPGFWGEGDRYVLGLEIKKFFDEICLLAACRFSTSDYWWDPATVSDTDLLIYFVDGPSASVVRQIRPNASLGSAGTTHISTAGNLSEVYLSASAGQPNRTKALAVLAFHEAMHNLLKQGAGLHGSGGMGLAAATVYATTQLTSRNKQLLAPVMGTRIPQNTSFL